MEEQSALGSSGWLFVAHYFTAFHCQISISETQNRSMRRKKKHSRGSESKKG